ncbi:MAG: hypothetical protein B2I17_09940 [Thermoplasmatales archaeon B_DKE]|nr:MAG: hypothetical protein B2I17_09940 [Thermoplasmatales archaeon B_DKE]
MLSLLSDIPKILAVIIYLADEAYIGVIGGFWYFLVKFGLEPSYAFPILTKDSSFMSFYYFMFNSIYFEIAAFVIVAASIYVLFSSSFGKNSGFGELGIRFSISVIVFMGSLEISQFIVQASYYVYGILWGYGNINWYSLLSVTNISSNISIPLSQIGASNALIEFFLLSWLFIATFTLLGMLIIRQAIIIFLTILLPVFSLLLMTKDSSKVAIKLWLLFIESAVLPTFVIILLILVHIFYGDFILQIGFLTLASLVPTLIMSNSMIYRFASFQSAYGEMSAASVLSGAINQVGYAGSALSGNATVPILGNMLSYPIWSKEKGNSGPLRMQGRPSGGIDWKSIENEKLKYRRER